MIAAMSTKSFGGVFAILAIAILARPDLAAADHLRGGTGGRTRCVHDPPAGSHHLSPQAYAHHHHHEGGPGDDADRRRRLLDEAEAIRIYVHYVEEHMTGLTSAQTTFLKGTLIPDAVAWFADAVKVVPVEGNLTLSQCNLRYTEETQINMTESTTNCASVAATPTCGSGVEIPLQFLAAQEYCTIGGVYGGGSCPAGEWCCREANSGSAAGGAGVADADIVIFVTASTESSVDPGNRCPDSAAAFASTCDQDQNDRPVAGYVNFCPEHLDEDGDLDAQLKVTLHEFMHVFAFSASLFPFFRDEARRNVSRSTFTHFRVGGTYPHRTLDSSDRISAPL